LDIDRNKTRPAGAHFDATISPIVDVKSTVNQLLCAKLCDVVRFYRSLIDEQKGKFNQLSAWRIVRKIVA